MGRRHTRRRRALVAAAAPGVLVAALVGGLVGTDARATTPGTTPAGTAAGTATAPTPPGPGDWGDLVEVCGPGQAAGATDQGVTDTEIVVGAASDPGNTIVPGLNQEIFDAADAFVGWCNAAGGINGRKITLIKHDAKLFEAAPRMVEACQTDFMLVGVGIVFDDAAQEPRLACNLAEIAAYATSDLALTADKLLIGMATSNRVSAMEPIFKLIAAADPPAAAGFAMWNNALPSIQAGGLRERAGAARAGLTEVVYEELPSSIDNWRPFVEKLKAANTQILSMINTPEQLVGAMKTMADVGYFPKYIAVQTNYYNPKLIEEAGSLLERTTVLINGGFVPFEQADSFPAMRRYIDNLATYANGASPKGLGINATSAWLAFAVAAKACGSTLTRDCVMAEAAKLTEWTAGGLHPPRPVANGNGPGPQCFFVYRATPLGFVVDPMTQANSGIYNCSAQHFSPVPGR